MQLSKKIVQKSQKYSSNEQKKVQMSKKKNSSNEQKIVLMSKNIVQMSQEIVHMSPLACPSRSAWTRKCLNQT